MQNKSCTIGKRHKWQFVRNATRTSQRGCAGYRVSRVGIYRCECGERKIGAYDINAAIKGD